MDNEWACYCAMISRAFSYISCSDKRSFSSSCKWTWVFTLQSKVTTESQRDIMNRPIRNIKAKWNSFAGLRRPATGFTRHPIWLNQMLWVTNKASQLRAAQRPLSCLLERATENAATRKTMWLLCRNVVYLIRQWWARLRCDLMLWTCAIAAGRDASAACQ